MCNLGTYTTQKVMIWNSVHAQTTRLYLALSKLPVTSNVIMEDSPNSNAQKNRGRARALARAGGHARGQGEVQDPGSFVGGKSPGCCSLRIFQVWYYGVLNYIENVGRTLPGTSRSSANRGRVRDRYVTLFMRLCPNPQVERCSSQDK